MAFAARKGDPGGSGLPDVPGAQGASGSRWIRPAARRSEAQPGLDTRLGTPTRSARPRSPTRAKVVHEKPTSLVTEVTLYSSTSLPSLGGGKSSLGPSLGKSLGRRSQRDPTSVAIERALDDPRALDHSPRKRGHVLARDLREAEHGLDAGAMSTLRRLDLRWSTFRRQDVAPIADSVFSPVFESKAARNLLIESGADLSQDYNTFGMGCLAHSPDIAYECLQRALFTAPRDSQEQALALSHLGVHAQSQSKTTQALRYLHRAVAVQAGSLASRVRVRLNLCAALNQRGDHPAALRLAEAARLMLVVEAEAGAEQPFSPGSSVDGERAGLGVEDDVAVLRALAHHNCCVCHEHMGRTSLALQEARRATRLARAVLEEDDLLLQQLEATEESVGVKERLQLSAAGRQQAGHLMRSVVSDPGLAQASAQQKAVAAAKLARGSPKLRHRSSRTLLQSLTKSTAATDAGRYRDRYSDRTVGVPRAAVASLPALGEGSPVRAAAGSVRRAARGGRHGAEATAGLGSSRARVDPGARSRPQPDKPSRQQGARQGGGGAARGGAARSDGGKERFGGGGGGGGGGGKARSSRTPPAARLQDEDIRHPEYLARMSRLLGPEGIQRIVRLQAMTRGKFVRRRLRQQAELSLELSSATSIICRAVQLARRRSQSRDATAHSPRAPGTPAHRVAAGGGIDGIRTLSRGGGGGEGGSTGDMTLERAELMLRRAQLRMTSSRRLAIEEEEEEAAAAGRTAKPPTTPLAGGVTRGVRQLGELAPLVRSDEARVVRRLASLGRKRPGRMSMTRCYADIGGQSLRIFLSSTFRDMSGERELLMKKYVPALRQVCHDKGVHLTVVDLRWGVTVEQASLGEVINICLAEVEACQYFVGFLGSRYGWCPQRSDIARSSFTKFPFLNSYVPGRSATEMEILYGALTLTLTLILTLTRTRTLTLTLTRTRTRTLTRTLTLTLTPAPNPHQAEFENPYILLVEKKVSTLQTLLPLLEQACICACACACDTCMFTCAFICDMCMSMHMHMSMHMCNMCMHIHDMLTCACDMCM